MVELLNCVFCCAQQPLPDESTRKSRLQQKFACRLQLIVCNALVLRVGQSLRWEKRMENISRKVLLLVFFGILLEQYPTDPKFGCSKIENNVFLNFFYAVKSTMFHPLNGLRYRLTLRLGSVQPSLRSQISRVPLVTNGSNLHCFITL